MWAVWPGVIAVLRQSWRSIVSSSWGSWAVIVALLVIACASFYRAGRTRGREQERSECQERATRALVEVTNENRKREVSHAQQIQSLQTEFARQQQQAAGVDARAAADLGSGARRMRFTVARASGAACPSATTAGRADAAPSAELAPTVAQALYAIAADGDEAIRQLTALQVWARDAVKLCGAVSP